jgi:hypothetical protein
MSDNTECLVVTHKLALNKESDIQHWMYVLFSEHGVLQQSQFDAAERIHIGYCGTMAKSIKCKNNSVE